MELMLLILSLLLNIGCIVLIIKSERYGHYIENLFAKLDFVEMEESHRPDYWTLQGWTNSIAKQHTQYDVAFIGNSLIYNGDFQFFFQNVKVINLGVSGNTLMDMQRRIPTLVAANPKKVFVMAGANDLLITSLEEYTENYKLFLIQIKNFLPHTRIFVQSMLPMNSMAGYKQIPAYTILEANKRVKELSVKEECKFIDLYSVFASNDELPTQYSYDGLHLRDSAYSLWAETIRDIIQSDK